MYSSVDSARPARTSSEELVTPPKICKHRTYREDHIELTLVGARVFEKHDLALLKMQTGLLGEEEVGTFNDVLEMWLALGIDERRHIRDIHSFRAVTPLG